MTQTQTATYIPQLKAQFAQSLASQTDAAEMIAPLDAELADKLAAVKSEHQAKHAELYKLYDDVKATTDSIEGQLREAVVNHYESTGEKSFDENLSVQVRTKLVYDDATAIDWAVFQAPFLVKRSIDKKAFEAIATSQDLAFVTTEKSVSAVIKGLK